MVTCLVPLVTFVPRFDVVVSASCATAVSFLPTKRFLMMLHVADVVAEVTTVSVSTVTDLVTTCD